ncbi:MAG: SEFIR domain-containing protein [Bacteroidia bacterium]|nr:SEFIR domain-containing protein [Bacteroidia bacterium]
MTRVFISYSHDSDEHVSRVRALAEQLNEWGGLELTLDLWESAPPQGWTAWMEQKIKAADFVLIVCSAGYQVKIEGQGEPSHGKGVKWEGRIIRNLLYATGSVSAKFIPVLLGDATESHLLTPLLDATWYRADTEAGFEKLYRHLTNQPLYHRPAPKARVREMPQAKPADSAPMAERPEAAEVPQDADAKAEIRRLISRGELRLALERLMVLPDAPQNELILLQARLSSLERDKRMGISTAEETTRIHNQITYALLELLNDLP